jgi:hypothetical protein
LLAKPNPLCAQLAQLSGRIGVASSYPPAGISHYFCLAATVSVIFAAFVYDLDIRVAFALVALNARRGSIVRVGRASRVSKTYCVAMSNTLANFDRCKRKGLCSTQSAVGVTPKTNSSAFAQALELVRTLSKGSLLRLINCTVNFWRGY